MKVICDGLDLSDAVLKVSKALSIKSANPTLEGIKLVASGDTITLTATDMELTLEITIKADVLMEGETVVVGKYFVDFIKKLENEQVELSQLYDGQLKIKYNENETELQVYNSEDFPKFNNDNFEKQIVLLQQDFKKIIDKVTLSCSTDDSRPILKGCLFEVSNKILSVVALDGFRMSVIKKEIETESDFYAIIPARTLIEITRLLTDDNDKKSIKLNLQKNTLYVENNNIKIFSRLIEGEFVKYGHILPTSFTNVVTVNKKLFLQSIERAGIIAKNDRFNIIKFEIKENIMNISAKSEIGNINENLPINLNGKDMTIAFNGKYISDYLKVVDGEFINLNLNSQIDPCVFIEVGKEDYIYLVLPIRINS